MAGWLREVCDAVRGASAARVLERCQELAARAEAMAGAMDFRFLYKADRHLFAIGYNVAQGQSGLGVLRPVGLRGAAGELPGHCPRRCAAPSLVPPGPSRGPGRGTVVPGVVGRHHVRVPDAAAVSPPLHRAPCCEESCEASVGEQMAYGGERRVPWGISESAFSSQYVSFDYQYQTFGVPALGLKRGLAQDLVIAPYATALAAMVRPHDALRNFRQLGGRGSGGQVRLLRGHRLHAQPAAGEPSLAGGALLHGPSSRHEPGGAGQLPAGRRDGPPLPRRADGAGHRAAVAGARAQRRRPGGHAR